MLFEKVRKEFVAYCSSIDNRSKANKQYLHKWLVSSCISATFLLIS
jgi:hypothetical protein